MTYSNNDTEYYKTTIKLMITLTRCYNDNNDDDKTNDSTKL